MEKYYRHFKGNVYRLVGIAKDSEDLSQVVVYQAMYGDKGLWVRPYDMFFGKVERDGKVIDRFAAISEAEALQSIPLEDNPSYHFPNIEYISDMLKMVSYGSGFSQSVKGMITLLQGRHIIPNYFLDGLSDDDDIEQEALNRICRFKPSDDPVDIFHLIEIWGGSSGRGIYVLGEGFDWGKIEAYYRMLIDTCLKIKEISDESIDTLVDLVREIDESVKYFGVSFITKHVRFWLYRSLGLDALPIYDSVMANQVMHRNTAEIRYLGDYWKVMVAKARRLGIPMMPLERQIFLFSIQKR